MADKIHAMNRQRQADRRVALLGLHAAGDNPLSSCLSADELACLVDGLCTDEEKEKYFDHLASCTACYGVWLQLSEVLQAEAPSKPAEKFRLFRSKPLAWAGSFLAAAASVVVFITISQQMPSSVLHQPMKSQLEQKKAEMVQVEKEAGPPVPRPAVVPPDMEDRMDAVEQELQVMEAAPVAPVPEQTIKAYRSAAPLFKAKKRSSAEAVQAAPPAADLTRRKDSRQLALWLDTIEQACLHADRDARFWREQFDRGKALTAHGMIQEQQLSALLPLVRQLKTTDDNQPVCRRILHILHPGHG